MIKPPAARYALTLLPQAHYSRGRPAGAQKLPACIQGSKGTGLSFCALRVALWAPRPNQQRDRRYWEMQVRPHQQAGTTGHYLTWHNLRVSNQETCPDKPTNPSLDLTVQTYSVTAPELCLTFLVRAGRVGVSATGTLEATIAPSPSRPSTSQSVESCFPSDQISSGDRVNHHRC